jgi:hypothetical protein
MPVRTEKGLCEEQQTIGGSHRHLIYQFVAVGRVNASSSLVSVYLLQFEIGIFAKNAPDGFAKFADIATAPATGVDLVGHSKGTTRNDGIWVLLLIGSATTNPNSTVSVQHEFTTLLNSAMKALVAAQLEKAVMLLQHLMEDAEDSGCSWGSRYAALFNKRLCAGS